MALDLGPFILERTVLHKRCRDGEFKEIEELAEAEVRLSVGLIRAVIADEAAKASEPAASEPEPDEPPQRAEGVPEWCKKLAASILSRDGISGNVTNDPETYEHQIAYEIREAVQAEIARRVAEERKDDELCGGTRQQLSEQVAKLTTERDAALAEVEKFKASAVGTLVADAIRADRESDERECRREIRRLRAEVERLSRPVDLGAVHKTRVDGIDYVYGYDAQQAVRLERNARESAESSLAELRELVRTHYLMWSAAGASTEWSFLKRMKSCPDADLDAALTEFRKHKEPAK